MRQPGKVPSRTDVNHADIHLCVKNPGKRLEFKQLIHESTVGIVRCPGKSYMAFAFAPYPFQKFGIFRSCEILVSRHDAVSVVGQMLRLKEGVVTIL